MNYERGECCQSYIRKGNDETFADEMAQDEKRRLMTQTVQIPKEIINELSTDGGMEGLKGMLVENGWDRTTPMAMMVHALDQSSAMESSKWVMLVSI